MSENDPNNIPPDPIYAKSLSVPIFVASLAVLVAIVLAIVDDVFWRRPYIGYQSQWKEAYLPYLRNMRDVREAEVNQQLLQLDRFQALDAAVADAAEATQEERGEVQRLIFNIDSELRAVLATIKSPRSEIAALNYKAEHAAAVAGMTDVATNESSQGYLEEIQAIRDRTVIYSWMERAEGATTADVAREEEDTIGFLIDRMLVLQNEKAGLQTRLASASAELAQATAARNQWLSANLGNLKQILDNADDDVRLRVGQRVAEVGVAQYIDTQVTTLKPEQLDGIIDYVASYNTGIRLDFGTIEQIHIPKTANWVDRCETCHLNTQAPLPVTAEAMGGNDLFASHPRRDELFAHHDPAEFGCSMCHNGNGVAITSVDTAHGLNKYWLHRLYPSENYEAGCVQCHVTDVYLEGGERHNAAKENYRHYGCWGCHGMTGYDDEAERARVVAKRISDIRDEIQEKSTRIDNLGAAASVVFDAVDEDDSLEDRANELSAESQIDQAALKMQIAGLRTEEGQLRRKLRDLYKEKKKVGPNLKDIRAKVRPEWLTPWVDDPTQWRPDTKMPVFRWANDEEAKDVAAFLWQAATDVKADRASYGVEELPTGDPTRGEKIFKGVGCLSCHGIEEGGKVIGNDFAANLSNLGDKYNRETGLAYYVHWIENPRHRLAPYCADCDRDLTPADFVKAGTDLVFGREHSTCPNCGFELQWDNPAVMPSFRLTKQEATDVATYLVGKTSDFAMESAPWLEEEERFDRGKKLVQHHGCAGCHEIGGLEGEQRIGTNLSDWGSKPMERLDFGHFTHDAKKGKFPIADWTAPKDDRKIFEEASDDYLGKWYNHRGFAMHKLAEPDIYDTSKNVDRSAQLRMPKFKLSGQEIFDISSLLMGAVSADTLPDSIKYNPDAEGEAIREGWWIVQKYNCQGCHQIRPGAVPPFHEVLAHVTPSDAPEYEKLPPPYLVGTGFRSRPIWLAGFLHDPSLGGGLENPKAVRPYLSVRMPTYTFTENEVGKLVRFFDAMSKQPLVYRAPEVPPLDATANAAAEVIFNDQGSCLQCHVVDGKAFTTETKAPNLTWAGQRLKPEWMTRWIENPAEMEPGTAMPALFKKECPSCQKQFDNAAMDAQARETGSRHVCANCSEDLSEGRWVYQNAGQLPKVDAYKGDHIDLMVRYLKSLGE
jgi:mono/diheme cytochrome c family protein